MTDAQERVRTGSWVNVEQIAFPSGSAPERFRLQCAASRLGPSQIVFKGLIAGVASLNIFFQVILLPL